MNDIIRKRLITMIFGVVTSLAVVLLSFGTLFYGQSVIEDNFYLGLALIGIVPLSIFFTAYYYQGSVIMPMRQLFAAQSGQLSSLQKIVVKSAEDSYNFAKWVPIIMTCIAAFMSVTLIPGAIAPYVLESDSFIQQVIACVVISGNFVLFLKMTDQIILAKQSMPA